MRMQKGTGIALALFLAFSLLCSVSLVAQDKLLTVKAINPSVNTNIADPTSVDCTAYAADKVTCIAGQYFHSDNARPNSSWVATATSSTFGNWITGNGSSSGCLSCHHSGVNSVDAYGESVGGGYLIGGHKNILRKIVPGQTLFDTTGQPVVSVVDHSGNAFTLNQTAGTIAGTLGTFPAYYLAGWTNAEDVFGNGSTLAYGSCARCHTTGYRPDAAGPEPTAVTGTYPTLTYTPLTNAQFNRTPVGSKSGDTTTTASWYLTGIQCERCHKPDMQYDATVVNPNYNSGTTTAPVWTATAGRVSHLVSVQVPASNVNTGACVSGSCPTLTPVSYGGFVVPTVKQVGTSGTYSGRPLPNVPSALTCIECHQTYSTWTSKVAGTPGQVHLTPLPGFESLAPKASGNYSTTKDATGQFSATFACSVSSITTSTPNYYNACIAAGGKVTYVPGGMSHGAVATILNSPHARVTGYVDVANPGSADNSLTIFGGALTSGPLSGSTVTGKYNSFFSSTGPDLSDAPAGAVAGATGSCAGCHNIHGAMPTYAGFNPPNAPVDATNIVNTLKNCTDCHGSHGKAMNHPTGAGTPFAAVNGSAGGFGSQESCSTCHFSKKTGTKYHFLRINPDPAYNTFPSAQQYYTTAGSGNFGMLNTYAESYTDTTTYQTKTYPAVGLDVDIACGQCHTGGDGSKNPYGITPYAGDGGVTPRAYSRAFLANAAKSMHNQAASVPTFSTPLPATGGPTTITITSTDISEGTYASIFYTTDGSVPTVTVNASEAYVGGGTTQVATGGSVTLTVNSTETIYALAAGPASYSFTPSAVVGGTYGVLVAPKPSISPTNANIVAPATVSVTITDSITASIYYTTDGTTPTYPASGTTALYSGAITVSSPEVIKAIAVASGYANSAVATGTFTAQAAAPVFGLNGGLAKYPGSYVGAVNANLTDAAPSLCYTTNGATPVVASGVCTTGTTVASGTNISIAASETIKVVAFGGGYSASKVVSGTYAIH